ncbi:hydrogenase assembly protein HypC [Clostridium polyendosporum]|uniref:Hydrogenase assembly protein HypC n=1 Tax=Clostridium polyendosporum TaxID=69208 RepID=A0A919VFF1_9CLOT|nr:HypC/HybG/HupF family hydrogenase formation chaperone [Clostridium polyendosporum]GIM28082.1 hydrogenase assembly protein HypC [Clostridium polyendosporum]
MCLAVPGKVLSIVDHKGVVEVGNMKREVFMHLVPDVKIGEYVLVHAGCAIQVVDEAEAMITLDLLKELAEDEVC